MSDVVLRIYARIAAGSGQDDGLMMTFDLPGKDTPPLSPAISSRLANSIHMVDTSSECDDLPAANGFTAFLTCRAHIEHFAENDADVALHKALYRNGCKVRASRARALCAYSPEYRKRLYKLALVPEVQLGLARRAGFGDVQT